MKKTDYALLFLIALIFFGIIATIQKVPGYMDAEYYFGQSIHLAEGAGWSEYFIWNFLNDPAAIPAPSFSFWLPLTSVIASAGLWLFHLTNYYVARIPFILLSATVPILAAYFAELFHPGRRAGWLAGGVSILSGFYLPFITITDTFTPYMVLGGVFFLVVYQMIIVKQKPAGYVLAGIIAGLMTLTRSDGIIWLFAGLLAVVWADKDRRGVVRQIVAKMGLLVFGFGISMVPWYIHNFGLYQRLYPPGNSLMLWLTGYNDLFVYPYNTISFSRWIESGFQMIFVDRLNSSWANLQTLIAAGGSIFVFPVMVIGYWQNKKNVIIRIMMTMLLITFGVMSFIFPYAGERGGFFHSLSAIQILLWALVPVGLSKIIEWGVRFRNWKVDRAWPMFTIAILFAVGCLSAFRMYEKVNNGVENGTHWNNSQSTLVSIEDKLKRYDDNQREIVMVNNPPGYSLATGRKSIMIPTGGTEAILDVCEKFDVGFLLVNDERVEVKKLISESTELQKHFDFLFDELGTTVYAFNP